MSMEEVRWKAVFPGIEVTSSILYLPIWFEGGNKMKLPIAALAKRAQNKTA